MASLPLQLTKQLAEIRFFYCPRSISSKGMRTFVMNNFLQLKQSNPNVKLLLRESNQIEPKMFLVDKLNGAEREVLVSDCDEKDIIKLLLS